MKLTVVGTSCSWFKRKNTSFIIDDDIVFDMPSGAFKDIINAIDIYKVRSVFISHIHTDHFSDLHYLLTETYRHLDKRNLKKLKLYGPKGLLKLVVDVNRLTSTDPQECSYELHENSIDFIELEDGMTFTEGKYKVTAYKMSHGDVETYGFTFEDEKGVVVGFSADTAMCDNLEKIVKNSDYAFVEMCRTEVGSKHLSIDEFLALAKKYPETKMFPVHTSDVCQEYAEKNGMNYVHDGQVLNFDE